MFATRNDYTNFTICLGVVSISLLTMFMAVSLGVMVNRSFAAPPPLGPPAPVPGYLITISDIKPGTGTAQAGPCAAEHCNAYNGKWWIPLTSTIAIKKTKSVLDPAGPDCYDASGLHPKRAKGCGSGAGDERMELVVESGIVQVIRAGGIGRVVWSGPALGNLPVTYTQSIKCTGAMSTCTVELVPDVNPTDYGQ